MSDEPLYAPFMIRIRRPVGVTILTILQIISGIGDILIGTLLILAYAVATALIGGGPLPTAFLLLAIVAFGLGIFSFALAYGLWAGKGWAWGLSVIGAIIGLTLGAISLAVGGLTLESFTSLLPIVLYALILVYLNTGNVRAFFGRTGGIAAVRTVVPASGDQPYMPVTQSPYPQPAIQQPYYPQGPFPQPTPWGASVCPNCGTPNQPGANFCDRCGTRLR